jgi:glycosyltransferase involved in cell wall biosynthesis
MRITYLHQYFNTPNMSGGTRSYEMARRLVALGHEVHMVTSWRESDTLKNWFETEEAGIRVHWLPVPYSNHMSYNERIRAFFKFALQSARKAASLETDIVFATSTPLTIALPAVYAIGKRKVPMVFEVRDLWPEIPIAIGALKNPLLRLAAKSLEKWAYDHASTVVALSPGMKVGVIAAGFPQEKVAVIPNSSDKYELAFDAEAAHRFRLARPWLGDKPLLVYAGTFGKVNGVGYAVDLAEELNKRGSDIRILLVGDGAERDVVMAQARQASVFEQNLFFEAKIPKSQVLALFSAATMASNLVIDLAEARVNSANKFFDTLAAGKPIFLNHGGWMHDLVLSHDCGLAMWRKPIKEAAEELDLAMHDSDWLAKTGKAARHLAENYFDRDKLAQQLEQILVATKEGRADRAALIAPGIYN